MTELTTHSFLKLAGRGPVLCTAEMSPQVRLYGYSHTEFFYLVPFKIVSIY